jgi:hypothetical protein
MYTHETSLPYHEKAPELKRAMSTEHEKVSSVQQQRHVNQAEFAEGQLPVAASRTRANSVNAAGIVVLASGKVVVVAPLAVYGKSHALGDNVRLPERKAVEPSCTPAGLRAEAA